MVKPCVKCGAMDRYNGGRCRPCVRSKNANWRKNNPGRVRSNRNKWAKANPKKVNIMNHNRRARTKGKLSQGLAELLYKRQKGLCVCCKQPLGEDFHLDHVMPLKLGGENKDSNMQLLKASCNLQKGAKHPVEYMQSRGLLL